MKFFISTLFLSLFMNWSLFLEKCILMSKFIKKNISNYGVLMPCLVHTSDASYFASSAVRSLAT